MRQRRPISILVLNTWRRTNIRRMNCWLKVSPRSLQLLDFLSAERAPIVYVWLLSRMELPPLQPVFKAIIMEFVAFQKIFKGAFLRDFIVILNTGYLTWVALLLREQSIHIWLGLSVGVLATVSLDHDLAFLDLIQTDRAAHVFYLFVVLKKFSIFLLAEFFHTLIILFIRRVLDDDIQFTYTYWRVCRSKVLVFCFDIIDFRVLTGYTINRLIFQHLLAHRILR